MVFLVLLQNCSNDYTKAKNYADAGNYEAFYSEISANFGDSQAKNLLVNYCFKAIQDGDLQQVSYFLDKQPTLIDTVDDEGNRALDVVLFDEHINLKMLKLLLQYHPQLDYIVHYYDMTPLQVITSGKYENLEALQLLLDNGANPNFVGNSKRSKSTPLLLSFVRNKIDSFALLIHYNANYKAVNNNIYDAITSSYALYLQNQGINVQNFYEKPLSRTTRSLLNSYSYKKLHEKNMHYLTIIHNSTKDLNKNSCATKKLVKWYIKTRESQALEFIMQTPLCKKALLEMNEFAIQNNNRVALSILAQRF